MITREMQAFADGLKAEGVRDVHVDGEQSYVAWHAPAVCLETMCPYGVLYRRRFSQAPEYRDVAEAS